MIENSSKIRVLEGDYGDQTLLNILCELRSRNPEQDELMFFSGGPINSRSNTSMIPLLGDLRLVFRQPEEESPIKHQDPLNGHIDLSKNPPHIRNTTTNLKPMVNQEYRNPPDSRAGTIFNGKNGNSGTQ